MELVLKEGTYKEESVVPVFSSWENHRVRTTTTIRLRGVTGLRRDPVVNEREGIHQEVEETEDVVYT